MIRPFSINISRCPSRPAPSMAERIPSYSPGMTGPLSTRVSGGRVKRSITYTTACLRGTRTLIARGSTFISNRSPSGKTTTSPSNCAYTSSKHSIVISRATYWLISPAQERLEPVHGQKSRHVDLAVVHARLGHHLHISSIAAGVTGHHEQVFALEVLPGDIDRHPQSCLLYTSDA